jgi:membrane protein implicated in regulation of membrane protease activity
MKSWIKPAAGIVLIAAGAIAAGVLLLVFGRKP